MAFLLKRNASVFCSTVESGFNSSNTIRMNLVDTTFSYTQTSTIDSADREELLGLDRGSKSYTSAIQPATFSFTTYLTKSNTDLPDTLLWEHFTNTTVSGNSVSFTNSNVRTLPYLYFFFEHEGNTYKLKDAVITSASIELNLDRLPTITWSGEALALEPSTAPSTFTDYKGIIPEIYSKLTTISCERSGDNKTYNLALTNFSMLLNNNVTWVGRNRILQITKPETHYLGNRNISGNMQFYLKTLESKILLDDMLVDLNSNIQRTYNITVSLGGASKFCQVALPKATLTLPNVNTDEVLTLNCAFVSEETSDGSADEATLTYNS